MEKKTEIEAVNQLGCWRKHATWNRADGVPIDSLQLTDKQKQAIRNGHTIKQGAWTFSPIRQPYQPPAQPEEKTK